MDGGGGSNIKWLQCLVFQAKVTADLVKMSQSCLHCQKSLSKMLPIILNTSDIIKSIKKFWNFGVRQVNLWFLRLVQIVYFNFCINHRSYDERLCRVEKVRWKWFWVTQCTFKITFSIKGSKFSFHCIQYCRAMTGSIEGPRWVLDPMRVDLCIPRVPWSHFCCIECKNIANI